MANNALAVRRVRAKDDDSGLFQRLVNNTWVDFDPFEHHLIRPGPRRKTDGEVKTFDLLGVAGVNDSSTSSNDDGSDCIAGNNSDEDSHEGAKEAGPQTDIK